MVYLLSFSKFFATMDVTPILIYSTMGLKTYDKTFLGFVSASAVSTIAAFYFLRQFIVVNAGSWTAPMFVPVYQYVIVIFVINSILGFIAYKKDRFLSLAFIFMIISVDILLLVALILNVKNPNG